MDDYLFRNPPVNFYVQSKIFVLFIAPTLHCLDALCLSVQGYGLLPYYAQPFLF
ncbi:hypothetical protein BDM02DRAFT_3110801 [Thelephora ganbajun]|uniref:Uncharacterized protein n=1 Tax=Thelephora ganbajun TaxID=370292 RepID=A0ACB6ZPJ0_THEGA|nr:hypothetical protein BDM02DRAFT_3110801 [Thelephora ganbajun]